MLRFSPSTFLPFTLIAYTKTTVLYHPALNALFILSENPIDISRRLAILVTCNYKGSPFKEKVNVLPGTDEDFTKMKATFEKLGCDIRSCQNSQATVNAVDDLMKRISSELKEYARNAHTCEEKAILS